MGRISDVVSIELSNEGILHVRWEPGAVVTEAEANTLKSWAAELSSGQSLPMLVEMAGMKWIARRAAEIFVAPWPLARMALVGTDAVDEVIASIYTSRHHHSCPTRLFASTDAAMTWLKEC